MKNLILLYGHIFNLIMANCHHQNIMQALNQVYIHKDQVSLIVSYNKSLIKIS